MSEKFFRKDPLGMSVGNSKKQRKRRRLERAREYKAEWEAERAEKLDATVKMMDRLGRGNWFRQVVLGIMISLVVVVPIWVVSIPGIFSE